MNVPELRQAVEATVSPLSDIARASVWQRVERRIDARPPPRVRPLRVRLALVASAAVAALAVTAWVSLRADAPSGAAPAATHAVVAAAGAHVTQRWKDVQADIVGPAELRFERRLGLGVLEVAEGTVHVRHAGAPLVVSTPTSTAWVVGPVFALRVHAQGTELASGEEAAAALVERTTFALAPPPAPAVPSPDPAPPAPLEEPRPRVRAAPRPLEPAPAPDAAPAPDDVPAPDDAPGLDEAPEPDPATVAAAVYVRAEAAMRAGEHARAERLLREVIVTVPGARVAAAARYDLARLAFTRGDHALARRLVDELLRADVDPNLQAPTRRLRCRIQRAAGEACAAD